MLLVY
jgi:hypothetical protein